jgi:hypothetical protein
VPPKPTDPGPGLIHNVMVRNVIAHVQGASTIAGHAKSWLEGVSFEGIKLFLSTDPAAPYDTSVHALQFRWARNLKVKDVEVVWDKPSLDQWQSALYFEDIDGLELNDFAGRQAWPHKDTPAVVLNRVKNARVINSRAVEGTNTFLAILGADSPEHLPFGERSPGGQEPISVSRRREQSRAYGAKQLPRSCLRSRP